MRSFTAVLFFFLASAAGQAQPISNSVPGRQSSADVEPSPLEGVIVSYYDSFGSWGIVLRNYKGDYRAFGPPAYPTALRDTAQCRRVYDDLRTAVVFEGTETSAKIVRFSSKRVGEFRRAMKLVNRDKDSVYALEKISEALLEGSGLAASFSSLANPRLASFSPEFQDIAAAVENGAFRDRKRALFCSINPVLPGSSGPSPTVVLDMKCSDLYTIRLRLNPLRRRVDQMEVEMRAPNLKNITLEQNEYWSKEFVRFYYQGDNAAGFKNADLTFDLNPGPLLKNFLKVNYKDDSNPARYDVLESFLVSEAEKNPACSRSLKYVH